MILDDIARAPGWIAGTLQRLRDQQAFDTRPTQFRNGRVGSESSITHPRN